MSLTTLFTDIADAIREKDGTQENIVASTFPERIRAIPTNGESGHPWLELPEPQDDELYFLIHIPEGESEHISFRFTCPGGYTVELGTVLNGAFAALKSPTTVPSNTYYEGDLDALDYGCVTSEGMAQAVIKVSGDNIIPAAPWWKYDDEDAAGIRYHLAEIKCRLTKAASFPVGSATEMRAVRGIRYFTWRGINALTSAAAMFRNCVRLEEIGELDTSDVSAFAATFTNCVSLRRLPMIDISSTSALAANLFTNPLLEHLVFDPSAAGWAGVNVNLGWLSFGHDAIVELLESLPTITENHSLTLTGNPGVLELTDGEKDVAADKNWTLVL